MLQPLPLGKFPLCSSSPTKQAFPFAELFPHSDRAKIGAEQKKIVEEGDGGASEGTPPPPAWSMFLHSPGKSCYSGYVRLVITVCRNCAYVLN